MFKAIRRRTGACLLFGSLVLLSAYSAQAQDTPGSKLHDIGRLFEITGMNKLIDGMIPPMMADQMKLVATLLPDSPPSALKNLEQLLVKEFKASKGDLLWRAAAIYDKYFTHEELRELMDWYQSPLGQKSISVMPALMIELGDAGRRWGEEVGLRVSKKMRNQIAK